MTETELIEAISQATFRPKTVVAEVVKGLKEQARKALENGEHVVLSGFGAFFIQKMKKKPLFGVPQENGTWSKVRFQLSRRRPLNGKVRSRDR